MTRWIEKQRSILDFTMASLIRRKGKNLSLLFVYTLVVFILASAMFFTHAMKREASLILKGAPEMVVQRLLMGRYDPIPVNYLQRIKKIRGVTSAEARLWGYYYDPVVGANYTLMAPRGNDLSSGNIIIGSGLAKGRMIGAGDIMSFRGSDGSVRGFSIVREISAASELVTADLILMTEQDFRELFGLAAPFATDITVTVRNPKELATIARKVTELLPDTRPIIRDEMVRTYDSVFDWRGGMVIILLIMALLAFIIFASEKASGLSAEEKREIGILKAIGWEISDVLAVKTYEGALISFLAFAGGVLLAYAHVFFSSAFLFAPALKGWSVLYPDFRITPFIDSYQLAVLFFLTVVPYTVATIIPSWKAAIIDPDQVMRS
ncbi:MAG: ABC transporter permease [Deltaproteobacteria bacterium HGW-Deltaproteobacteria-6]|jgi:ABC-type lipoprotein release transport system permease subunit|nr:MAG: ABC transporter permease [Deltaproteobacteria bacterium HGW-Deltaproteobacteria-6]